MEEISQVYVKLLDGKSRALNFRSPSIPVISVKSRISGILGIPIHEQRLVTGTKQLEDSSILHPFDGTHQYPVLHLLGRLFGGKGGFGSLLRGAATKAGQKKTNNFDACRDMSGRRLRHVNAEKKLEEWRAEAEERQLEKIAEDFIKKRTKAAVKKAGASGEAEKYVEKYREDSAKCMEVVEKSVREAMGSYVSLKRKMAGVASGSDAKRLKIRMGKRKVGDSDSDNMDEDSSDNDEDEKEKSVVLNNANSSDSNKEAEGSLGSVTCGRLDGESTGGGSSASASEDEKETSIRAISLSGESSDGCLVGSVTSDAGDPVFEILEENMNGGAGTEDSEAEKKEYNESKPGNLEVTVGQPPTVSRSTEGEASECGATNAELNIDCKFKPALCEESVVKSTPVSDIVKPLNFEEIHTAAELEALGMERLKSELQSHGLKCGGTLQERAARLFLLKTTPLEMLPKKLLAKK